MNVLLHINQLDRWNIVISDLRALLDGCTEEDRPLQIQVVAAGESVRALIQTEAEERGRLDASLQFLSQQGVTFTACGNALEKYCIAPDTLLPFVTTVPSGAVELARRQLAGWAYLKP